MNLEKLKNQTIYEYYYPLVIIGYILTLFLKSMRPGVFAAALMLLCLGTLAFTKKLSVHCVMDILVVAYFVYNLLSVIWLRMGGLPVTVYLDEFAQSVLPMVFYFVGKKIEGKADDFYLKFLIALLAVQLLGLILNIAAPQFYIDYAYEWSFISKADAPTLRVRMDSVIGCTVFGALSVIGILVSAYFLKEKKTRWMSVIFMAVNFIFAVLSNMRSAMVAAIIAVIYVNHLLFFQLKLFKKKYFVIECIVVAAAFVGVCIFKMDLVMKVWWRLESLPGAISQRSEQWIAAVNNMYSTWLGNGLGANGHKALGLENAFVVADGGLVKLYAEEGVLGFSLFVYMIVLTIGKGLKNTGRYFAETGIIVMMLLQSVGSNIIAFQLITPILWFCIGRINEDNEHVSSPVSHVS